MLKFLLQIFANFGDIFNFSGIFGSFLLMLLADVSQVSLSGTICKSDGQRFKKMICKIKSIVKYDILSSIQIMERTHSLL